MRRDCYPLVINLPDGKRAEYIAGERPARYTIDGEPCDIDVTIPDDLAATGWYWSGSFLYQPWPEREDGPGVAISTGTYPPPGYGCDDQGTCFAAARRLDAKRVELHAARTAKPSKKTKRRTPKIEPVKADLTQQLEMAL